MAYTFTIDGDVFSGRTIPGAARMRIYHQSSNSFIAAFDPDTDTLLGDQPRGSWTDVTADVNPDFLKQIEPDVIAACRERRLWFQQMNQARLGR